MDGIRRMAFAATREAMKGGGAVRQTGHNCATDTLNGANTVLPSNTDLLWEVASQGVIANPYPFLNVISAGIFSVDWKSNPEPEGTSSDLILVDEKNHDDDLPRALFRHSISFDQFFPLNKHHIS